MKNLYSRISFLLAAIFYSTAAIAAERIIPPAFGPYVNLSPTNFAGASSFTSSDKIIGTYFFYWYDVDTQSHIRNADGSDALTTHPPTLEDFSYKSVRWYKEQLTDMEAAGIDVALMVFWGSPAEHATNTALNWSFAGSPPLVQAREELLREGKHPPRLGLFYDTSTLKHNHWGYHADLTTDFGKQFFYGTVRDFFSCLPPQHWAMIDGKPIVLLYSAGFAKKWDQSFIDYTRTNFAKEFAGRVPWLAPQDSWGVKADSTCAWGGALRPLNPGIGEIGPGYDHSAVPGREPLVRDRAGGKFYEESWRRFLRRPSNLVMIETWNEFHEGTDIAASKEYGRQYIELTRKYADLFKRSWKPSWSKGAFSDSSAVTIAATNSHATNGLTLLPAEDGRFVMRDFAQRRAWAGISFQPGHGIYLYFAVDDSFKSAEPMNATVTLEYYDAAPGWLNVDFDGSDTNAPFNGAYSRSQPIPLVGDQRWKSGRFILRDARWLNSQNAGADFRVVAESPQFGLGSVTLQK